MNPSFNLTGQFQDDMRIMFRRETWLVNWDHVSVSPVHRASWQTSGEGCSVWLCRCLLWSRLRCGSESSSGCFPAETQRTEVTTRTRENQTCHLVSSKLVLQRLHVTFLQRRVLRSTLQRRPWCRAETSARPGTFWRARCEERRTVEPSRCCTETERRCSEEREDTDRQRG